MTTFAEQAVIAVENARLVRALQRQTEELSRFVTPQVASLLSSEEGEQLLAGHRRLIAAVFCDLRGFTTFSETAEPEEVFDVLRDYQAAMGQLIAEHGGTLEHLAGDGIMLFFNDPVPRPGFEPRRFGALSRCGIGSERLLGAGAAAAMSSTWASAPRSDMPPWDGLATKEHFQYNAIGNAVILASRLSGEAKGGEILISQRLYAEVEDPVEVGPVREVALKGFAHPVLAYNIVGLKAPSGG